MMLLATDDVTLFQIIAAAVFLIGGVVMVIQTLKHNLLKSKMAVEEAQRRQDARAEYWRTMDAAVEALSAVIDEIDKKIDDRSETLTRLSEEAETSIANLARSLESAEAELKTTQEARAQTSVKAGRRASGKVVNMKAAGAALVRRTHRQIYESFDMGQNIQDISRETGLGIGEIELILALRERIERQGS